MQGGGKNNGGAVNSGGNLNDDQMEDELERQQEETDIENDSDKENSMITLEDAIGSLGRLAVTNFDKPQANITSQIAAIFEEIDVQAPSPLTFRASNQAIS